MFGRGNQLALHNPSGGFVGIGQRVLNRGAIFGVKLSQNGLLLILFQILDERDRVIGVHLPGKVSNHRSGQNVEQILADVIVDFGEHIAAHQITQRPRQIATIAARGQFEQIGNVGGVQRLREPIRVFAAVFVNRVEHRADEVRQQPVVFIQCHAGFKFGGDGVDVAAHRCSPWAILCSSLS